MEEKPEQRPEGRLIAAALKRSGMSQRQAAAAVPMSENRWRAIMHGYHPVSAGVFAPVRGPADTVAKMAKVVGVTPEQLETTGERPDAAEELRLLLHRGPVGELIETTRTNLRIPIEDVLAAVHIDRAEWDRLLALDEFRGADVRTVGQLAHAVRLGYADVEPIDMAVADEMRRVEVNRGRRAVDDRDPEIDRLYREAEEKLRLLSATGLRAVIAVENASIEGNNTA